MSFYFTNALALTPYGNFRCIFGIHGEQETIFDAAVEHFYTCLESYIEVFPIDRSECSVDFTPQHTSAKNVNGSFGGKTNLEVWDKLVHHFDADEVVTIPPIPVEHENLSFDEFLDYFNQPQTEKQLLENKYEVYVGHMRDFEMTPLSFNEWKQRYH